VTEPRPTRRDGYPWDQYATGEWTALREMPVRLASTSGHRTIAAYRRDTGQVGGIVRAVQASGMKWAARRGYTFSMRVDRRAGVIYVRLAPLER
jgi:hypothetical protein